MKQRILLLVGVLGCIIATHAQAVQQKEKKRGCSCSFSSINQLGLLEGEKSSSFQLQTINGIRYKTWFAGAGVGLDYYHVRGIPVFLDLRKDILRKASTPFIYADGGVHFAWARNKDKPAYGRSEFNNGVYYDFGLGYKLHVTTNQTFLLSAGYSFKALQEKRITSGWYCMDPPCPEAIDRYDHKLNRVSLKLGLQL